MNTKFAVASKSGDVIWLNVLKLIRLASTLSLAGRVRLHPKYSTNSFYGGFRRDVFFLFFFFIISMMTKTQYEFLMTISLRVQRARITERAKDRNYFKKKPQPQQLF